MLEQALIEDLPSNGRDFTNLLELSAGAANLSGGSQAAWAQHGLNSGFAEVSLNGARPESTSFMVDGVTDTDSFFGGIANTPSEFAVQEVKVQTGLYSSEYGQGSGQVDVAIKSGTNSWHGQAYDFLQNDRLNPSSPLQEDKNITNGTNYPTRTPFKQNQFGGTLGGPVRIPFLYNGRDKTFWFVAYDGGRRSTSSGSLQTDQIPSANERTGNFSDWPYPIYDPTTNGTAPIVPCDPSNPNTPCNPLGRQAFGSNQIPKGRISAMGQKLLSLYPTPNTPICTQLPCQNYSIPLHNSLATDNITMRVDQNWREKDRLYFTGHVRREDSTNPNLLPYSGSTTFTHSELFGLNWEHFFSAHTMNTARLGFNRQFFSANPDTAYGPDLQTALGFQNAPSP
ncbi:MAG: Plug domain-containing protein, partial [Terriglobia bacterium]